MNISEEDRIEIITWARRHPEIKKVYLYGSRARGDNKPSSDIDLAIEIEPQEDETPYTTWFYWHLDYKEKPDLNLSNEPHLEWYEKDAGLKRVGPGVENDGILLYNNKKSH